MSTEWGDLERRLHELSSDLGGVSLPGPQAARRRARQRTRRQVAGAAVGIAAAAFGVIALGGLGPLSATPPEPADTPTPPAPTPGPDDAERVNELILTVEDLEAASGVEEPVGWQVADGRPGDPFLCAPVSGGGDRLAEAWFQRDPDGYLHQFVEISTADSARTRFDQIIEQVLSCVEDRNAANPDDNWLSTVWTVDGLGDSTWLAEYMVEPRGPNGELMGVQVNVVLAGDTVTTITQGGPSMEGHNVGPLPYGLATAAADRLCWWAGRDCTAEPTPQRVHPPVRTEVEPGWLTIDDIVTTMPYFEAITEVGDIADGAGYGHVCLDGADPMAAGAEAVPRRGYTDDNLDIHFFEFIAQFDTGEAARAHYEELVTAVESCGVEPLGVVEDPGFEGSAWRVDDEFAAFHLGAVIRGSRVGVLVMGEPSSAPNELAARQTLDLLYRAGIRLAELE